MFRYANGIDFTFHIVRYLKGNIYFIFKL